jgi:hypothetical protein
LHHLRSLAGWLDRHKRTIAVLGTALLAFALFGSTLQLDINGSRDPYATDVGEIQNALPRWGILHFRGYPSYSMLGSAFVTLLRVVGLQPALGASLFSALWGAVSVALLVALALFLHVPPAAAAVSALLLALSTSFWVDASIAEIHTMAVALTLGTILIALRYHRHGEQRDLLWLAFLGGQTVAHQLASALLIPALALLVFSRWRTTWAIFRRAFPALIALALLGPLTYLYLPVRVWQGADWVFGEPGTWEGFRSQALDSKSRIIRVPQTVDAWIVRFRQLAVLLHDDWPLPLLALGLLGLLYLARQGQWPEAIALSLVWAPFLALSLVIWENRVSDALLAAKLPLVAMAALGTALLLGALLRRSRPLGHAALLLCLGIAGLLYAQHRPTVIGIVRDPQAEEIIAMARLIEPAPDGKPVVLTALWGVDYWSLAYAQEYRGEFPHVRLVKHDADFAGILARGEHLVTLSHTFYSWPMSKWEQRLGGPFYLSSFAPHIIEMDTRPPVQGADVPPGDAIPLGNGVLVRHASLSWAGPDLLVLTVYWQAETDGLENHSVGVHLLSQDPPAAPDDLLLQADRDHPVSGWYRVSWWHAGEIVRDHYPLQVPPGTTPRAVRFNMYQSLGDGTFRNTPWISLPVPPR